MVKLEKQGDSDQHGYVIGNLVIKDTYIKVTEESVGSKKRAVRFENISEEVIIMSGAVDYRVKITLITIGVSPKPAVQASQAYTL